MADAKAPRPKLSRADRAAQLRAKAQRLEALDRDQERRRDTRRKVIIGGAIIAEARENAEFAATIAELLKRRVTREIDVEAVSDWASSI